jgi:tetratricopeptide (TPR) repeat protein
MPKRIEVMGKLKAIIPVLFLLFLVNLAGECVGAQERSDGADATFEEATRLHQSGDLEGAVRGYQAILAKHPGRIDVRSNLGAALSRLGRYEDAIAQYKKALAQDPRNHTIRYNLALAYYKAAFFAEAAGELAQLIDALPKTQTEWLSSVMLLADCQVRLGEYKKVIELLSPLEATYGGDRAFAYLLGSALISDNQIARGQVLIDRVFREEDSAEARLLIGSILLLADKAQDSLKEFERAVALNPKLPGVQAWYGRALMRLGDGEKAISVFKTALAYNPQDFDANLYLGILLKRDKVLEEAGEHLTRAARLRPRDSYARYHLGALYATQGRPSDALPLLEGVVKEFPDFVEARVLLASVYYRLNRKADADRERAIIQKLNEEQQAKQPGAQSEPGRAKSDPPDGL